MTVLHFSTQDVSKFAGGHGVPIEALLAVRMRREIHDLEATALGHLRSAFTKLYAKTGAGGYQGLAGIHGAPQFKCPHHTPLFLPWHRAYILWFENALRKMVSGVTLPFWNWAAPLA